MQNMLDPTQVCALWSADWQVCSWGCAGQDQPQVGTHSSAAGRRGLQQLDGHGQHCHVVQLDLVHEQSHLCMSPLALHVLLCVTHLCCSMVLLLWLV